LTNVIFIPIRLATGLAAGLLGKKLVERVWAMIDSEPAPDPQQRDVSWTKLLIAFAIEGAILRATRGGVDRAVRVLEARATGSWPGEDDEQSEAV